MTIKAIGFLSDRHHDESQRKKAKTRPEKTKVGRKAARQKR